MTDIRWLQDLTHKDWLFDGHPCSAKQFADLKWERAWIDMGPSIAGNPGPYWHVPHKNGDTTHRLYPKLLQTKWLRLVRHAIEELNLRTRSQAFEVAEVEKKK